MIFGAVCHGSIEHGLCILVEACVESEPGSGIEPLFPGYKAGVITAILTRRFVILALEIHNSVSFLNILWYLRCFD